MFAVFTNNSPVQAIVSRYREVREWLFSFPGCSSTTSVNFRGRIQQVEQHPITPTHANKLWCLLASNRLETNTRNHYPYPVTEKGLLSLQFGRHGTVLLFCGISVRQWWYIGGSGGCCGSTRNKNAKDMT